MEEINIDEQLGLIGPSESETLTFYDGKVTLYYHDKLHCYYRTNDDGEKFVIAGVTTVTGKVDKSGPLCQWAANQTSEYVKDALPQHTKVFRLALNGEKVEAKYVPLDVFENILNEARFKYKGVKKQAADTGKIAHEWLERHINQHLGTKISSVPWDHEEWPDDELATNCIKAALGWMEKHEFEPVESEFKVYSREYDYCGTGDLDGYMVGCNDPKCCPAQFAGVRIHVLADLKTSSRIYEEYRLQTAAYQYPREEENPELSYDARLILRVDKNGDGFETLIMPRAQFEADFQGYLGALSIYNWDRQIVLNKRYDKAAAKAAAKVAKVRKPRKVKLQEVEA